MWLSLPRLWLRLRLLRLALPHLRLWLSLNRPRLLLWLSLRLRGCRRRYRLPAHRRLRLPTGRTCTTANTGRLGRLLRLGRRRGARLSLDWRSSGRT